MTSSTENASVSTETYVEKVKTKVAENFHFPLELDHIRKHFILSDPALKNINQLQKTVFIQKFLYRDATVDSKSYGRIRI